MKFLSIFFVLAVCFSSFAVALEVSPDGPRIVALQEDAASVIVGNPAHATVVLDNPRLLIVTAGIPGMTRLTVLGRTGKVIMSENVISNGATAGMVRVRNACINGGEGCRPTRMFYCEQGEPCHNVMVNEPTQGGNGSSGQDDSGGADLGVALEEGMGE